MTHVDRVYGGVDIESISQCMRLCPCCMGLYGGNSWEGKPLSRLAESRSTKLMTRPNPYVKRYIVSYSIIAIVNFA